MTKLENFEAYHNFFTGDIPPEIALPSLKRIGELLFVLPFALTRCFTDTILARPDIFNNQFNGSLPDGIGNATALQIFHAKDNSLTGTIPNSFGDLSFLSWFDVSKNRLTGTIPDTFSKSTTIEEFRLGGNKLYGTIPRALCTNQKINAGMYERANGFLR